MDEREQSTLRGTVSAIPDPRPAKGRQSEWRVIVEIIALRFPTSSTKVAIGMPAPSSVGRWT